MGETTKIEWAHATFNPWIGCTRVSPGCQNCYAERYGNRFDVKWGPGQERRRTSRSNWRGPVQWNAQARLKRQRWAELGAVGATPSTRVFCASLADWLDHEVPIDWLCDLLDLVRTTSDLTWLLLTKRPQAWRARLEDAASHEMPGTDTRQWVGSWLDGDAPKHVWLGTTVEDQRRAEDRVPILTSLPARRRFLSCEPLLERVDLADVIGVSDGDDLRLPGIDWVISGGESGPGARPMHPDWARVLRDQAQAAGVAYLFKQWGDWGPPGEPPWSQHPVATFDDGGGELTQVFRVGKVAAGRELDGRTWDEVCPL